MSLDTSRLMTAMRTHEYAQDDYSSAETRRRQAWDAYIVARDEAEYLRGELSAAEAEVRLAAREVAGDRPNRDERRAQVFAGLNGHTHVAGYEDEYDEPGEY